VPLRLDVRLEAAARLDLAQVAEGVCERVVAERRRWVERAEDLLLLAAATAAPEARGGVLDAVGALMAQIARRVA
jgi:hypothetical protein